MLKSQSVTFRLAALKSFTIDAYHNWGEKNCSFLSIPYFAMHPSQLIQSVGHLLPFNKKKSIIC